MAFETCDNARLGSRARPPAASCDERWKRDANRRQGAVRGVAGHGSISSSGVRVLYAGPGALARWGYPSEAGKSRSSPCRGRRNPPAILAAARWVELSACNFMIAAGFQPAAAGARERGFGPCQGGRTRAWPAGGGTRLAVGHAAMPRAAKPARYPRRLPRVLARWAGQLARNIMPTSHGPPARGGAVLPRAPWHVDNFCVHSYPPRWYTPAELAQGPIKAKRKGSAQAGAGARRNKG